MSATLYARAVEAARKFAQDREQRLSDQLTMATAELYRLVVARLLETPTDSPARPLAELVANRVTVGREDRYPEVTIDDDSKRMIFAYYKAGALESTGVVRLGGVRFYINAIRAALDPHLFESDDDERVRKDAEAAFSAWQSYTQRQVWKEL